MRRRVSARWRHLCDLIGVFQNIIHAIRGTHAESGQRG